MKKFFLLILIIFLVTGAYAVRFIKYKINKDLSQIVYMPTPFPSISPVKTLPPVSIDQSVFVPSWSIGNMDEDSRVYDQVIYFSIKPDASGGINLDDAAQESLREFSALFPDVKRKLLTVQMTDNQENLDILGDVKRQKKIISDTIEIAQDNNLQGVVLDLEVKAIPFESLLKQINNYTNIFYTSCKQNNLSFSLALYGDVFYRTRPYDIKSLSKNADKIMIMAYDLSKSKGNPGPNFPLGGDGKYGYDIGKMTDDFLQFIPASKISVIFGLFGYDWKVNSNGMAYGQAKALTYSQIKQKFIDQCAYSECRITRLGDAAETEIHYRDDNGEKHILWFEDMESVRLKKEYLQKKGIGSFSYWAYSYF